MSDIVRNPGLRASAVLLAALSLSIGWGIRGNFGHEYGAMIPGALTAIAVCLMSGREDWRRRVAYFAFFGAVGWAFGGSISYGMVGAFAHSTSVATQLYGFGALFLIGFLWGGMGGAGTAFPAVADRDRLTQLFRPLVWVFVTWWLWDLYVQGAIESKAQNVDGTWNRHLSPVYWFDSDWLKAVVALGAVCLFDLGDKTLAKVHVVVKGAALGAFAGLFLQTTLDFHLIGFMPALAIASAIATGIRKNVYDEALAVTALIGAGSVIGFGIAFSIPYVFDAWYAEAGCVIAIALAAIWERRSSDANFALALFGGFLLAALIAGLWDLEYDRKWSLVIAVFLYVGFATWLALPAGRIHRFGVYGVVGALSGVVIHKVGAFLGLGKLGALIVNKLFEAFGSTGPFPRYLGDVDLFTRAEISNMDKSVFTERQWALVEKFDGDVEAFRQDLFTNWPDFVGYDGVYPHLGWIIGLLVGLGVFFRRHGRFQDGSKLLVYMALGWLIGFLLLPVFFGIRMTPPRGDDWAGILGLYVATLVYLFRTGLAPVVYASIVSAVIGGIGFSGATFLKLMMMRPGNANVVDDPQTLATWLHYQSANWHSFMEQSYGFINGIGIAIAIALIARRVQTLREDTGPARDWTKVFSVGFVLLLLVFVNWRKVVGTWVDAKAVPSSMKMFWFEEFSLPASTWFALVYWIVGGAAMFMLIRHMRRPMAFIPTTSLGQGQLLFLVFLWVCVIFNNERAITGFSEGRLITEAVLFVNAAIATVLLLVASRTHDPDVRIPRRTQEVPYVKALLIGVVIWIGVSLVQTATTQIVYGGAWPGHSGHQYRFGSDAEWRVKPLQKSEQHN